MLLQAEFEAGQGTYQKEGYICASLVGIPRIVPPGKEEENAQQKARIEVLRKGTQPVVPAAGDTVTARVLTITPRIASVDILCVGAAPVVQRYSGVIRSQDVRATEIDKVKLHESYRPGDIIRALVLSLGDARSYYLTTAKDELGVVHAKSLAGESMIPLSDKEMRCPKSGLVELRKVAKADPAASI